MKIEQPTITCDKHATYETHPAYGQIGVYRTSGQVNLHGSEFLHQSFVTVRLSHGSIRHTTASDMYLAEAPIVELRMSEAQWATFVSSFNIGDGVPCTLARFGLESVPGVPPRDSRASFRGDKDKHVQVALDTLTQLREKIQDTSGLSKKTAELFLRDIQAIERQITDTIPFIAERFEEHMEETVEKAKIEINAYSTGAVLRAGLQALGGGNVPLVLEDKSTDNAD